jgi:hypothetical protein
MDLVSATDRTALTRLTARARESPPEGHDTDVLEALQASSA